MNSAVTRTLQIVGASLLGMLPAGGEARAWGPTTHANVAEYVARRGGMTDSTRITNLRNDANWADVPCYGEDGVGAKGWDEEYNPWYDNGCAYAGNADHWFDVWNYDHALTPQGTADWNTRDFYASAVAKFTSNDPNAWANLGRAQHFLQDVGMPYHTILWGNVSLDNWHAQYESWVDGKWTDASLKLVDVVRRAAYAAHCLDGRSYMQTTIDVAHWSNRLYDTIKDGAYTSTSNAWATQHALFYTAQGLAYANSKARPSDFLFPSAAMLTRNTNPSCSMSRILEGTVRGDSGGDVVTDTFWDEQWFQVTLSEANTSSLYLSADIELINPSNVDYDLYVYCVSCGGTLIGSSTLGAGQIDRVQYRKEDSASSDTRVLLIEARYYNASSCSPFSLRIKGNTAVSTVRACP